MGHDQFFIGQPRPYGFNPNYRSDCQYQPRFGNHGMFNNNPINSGCDEYMGSNNDFDNSDIARLVLSLGRGTNSSAPAQSAQQPSFGSATAPQTQAQQSEQQPLAPETASVRKALRIARDEGKISQEEFEKEIGKLNSQQNVEKRELELKNALIEIERQFDNNEIDANTYNIKSTEIKNALERLKLEVIAQRQAPQTSQATNRPEETALTAAQKRAIRDSKAENGNISFGADPNNEKVLVSGQKIGNLESVIEILPNGTRIQRTKNHEENMGAMSALKGTQGGLANKVVGGVEVAGGAIITALTGWTGIGAVGGAAMVADGARRMYNGFNGDTPFKATITHPDGSQEKIAAHTKAELDGLITSKTNTGSRFSQE